MVRINRRLREAASHSLPFKNSAITNSAVSDVSTATEVKGQSLVLAKICKHGDLMRDQRCSAQDVLKFRSCAAGTTLLEGWLRKSWQPSIQTPALRCTMSVHLIFYQPDVN